MVGPPLADGCQLVRPSVGIYIGPRLGAQIGMRSPQRLAHNWPNKVIVKLTVGPLQVLFACPTMGQRSILVRFLFVYISARYWERKAALNQCNGWQMVWPSMLSYILPRSARCMEPSIVTTYFYFLATWLPLVVITEYKLQMHIIIIKLCLPVVVKVTKNICFMRELDFYPLYFLESFRSCEAKHKSYVLSLTGTNMADFRFNCR